MLGPVEAGGDERGVALLLDDAALHQIVDEDGRAPVVLRLLLHLDELGLQLNDPGLIRTELVLLVQFILLVLLDLLPGPSPLGADLEHVHALPMLH